MADAAKTRSPEEWEKFKADCLKKFPNLKFTRLTLKSNDDVEVMLIRQLLARPPEERTHFLRIPTPDGRGAYL